MASCYLPDPLPATWHLWPRNTSTNRSTRTRQPCRRRSRAVPKTATGGGDAGSGETLPNGRAALGTRVGEDGRDWHTRRSGSASPDERTDGIGVRRLSAEIYESAGKPFNINSPQQLSKVLFDDLNLPASFKASFPLASNLNN